MKKYDSYEITEKLNKLRQGSQWGENKFAKERLCDILGISKSYFQLLVQYKVFTRIGKDLYCFTNINTPVHVEKVNNAFNHKRKQAIAFARKELTKTEQVTVTVVQTDPFEGYTVEKAIEFLKSKNYKLTIEI